MKSLVFIMLTAVFSVSLLGGCGPSEDIRNIYRKTNRYPQKFKISTALLVRERNGFPFILASAFLIDKERGLFASAKHFVGNESAGDCKIFFNGVVYEGFLLVVPAITDMVIIKIKNGFDSKDFPEPRRLAERTHHGDKIFVEGIHAHPKQFQAGQEVIPIFSEFYGLTGKGEEFVFERLEGEVVRLDREIASEDIKGSSEVLSGVANSFIELRTKRDHRFSFAGLSGGPTVNERDEIVGINAVEEQAYLEITQRREVVYHPWTILNLVPAIELEKLRPLLANIR